ncbi:hypothetical protein Tco_0527722 [Tanacetum coccineum]
MVNFAVNGLDSRFVTLAEIIRHRKDVNPSPHLKRSMSYQPQALVSPVYCTASGPGTLAQLVLPGQPMSQSKSNGILGAAPVLYASQPASLPSAFSTMSLQDPTWNMDTSSTSHLNSDARNLKMSAFDLSNQMATWSTWSGWISIHRTSIRVKELYANDWLIIGAVDFEMLAKVTPQMVIKANRYPSI